MKPFCLYLNMWRCAVADVLYAFSGKPIKELVDADAARNLKWSHFKEKHSSPVLLMNYCLLTQKEFRSVFHLRMRHHKLLCGINDMFLPRMKTIEFGNGGIGGGLMVSHYHSVIFPKLTGKNFRVGPGVVIGRNGDFPVFGDNVYVAANATMVGDITIGSNVIIGAGSVVTKDVPDNVVVVGNPAKVIKTIDDNEDLLNEIR